MNITFVTESHPFNDDKQSVDVAEQSALDEANRNIATIRLTSVNHERTMKDVARKLKQANEKSSQNTEWIRGLEAKVNEVEARVDALPQALREALDCALKEMLEGKLSLFEKLIANLRQESERMATELADLQRQRDEMKVEMENLRNACDEMKNLYETRLKTIGDRISDAWHRFLKRLGDMRRTILE